eukprot:286840_1
MSFNHAISNQSKPATNTKDGIIFHYFSHLYKHIDPTRNLSPKQVINRQQQQPTLQYSASISMQQILTDSQMSSNRQPPSLGKYRSTSIVSDLSSVSATEISRQLQIEHSIDTIDDNESCLTGSIATTDNEDEEEMTMTETNLMS